MKAAILVLLALITGACGGAAIAVLVLRQHPAEVTAQPPVVVETPATPARENRTPPAFDESELAELHKSVSALKQHLARIEEQLASTNRDVLRHSLHLDAIHNPISPLQSRGTPGERYIPMPRSPLIPLGLGVTPRDQTRGPVWDTSGQPAPVPEEGEETELPLPQW